MEIEKSTKIACEVFIKKENQILLGKRKNCFGDGTWGLPGGHLEFQEKLFEAAQRELKEELNIDCTSLKLVAISEDTENDEHYVHISFLCEDFSGEITNNEPEKCYEWGFFELNSLPSPIFPPHLKILKTFSSQQLYLQER